MFEDTAKFQKPQRGQETIQEQVRSVTQSVNDMIDLLRSQQEVLRQYGMNIPASSLDGLRKMRMRLDNLGMQLMGAQSELRQLRGLAETTALINSSLESGDVLNQVIDKVVQLTGAERGYILLRNEETGELEFRVARGIDQEQLDEEEFIVSNTIVQRVVETGEPVLTHNALNDPRYQGQESIIGFALRSILAVPLKVNEDVIGVVYCDNRIRAGLFKDHELNLLNAFANQAAVAIQNARLFEAVRAQLAEITEIRDLMDNVFTSIVSGLITLNRNFVITAYNAAAERIIGIDAMQALGQPFQNVVPQLNGEFSKALEQAREHLVEIDITLENPWRYWKVKLSPLRDANGETEGVAVVLDDLTDEKVQEAQLDAAIRYMPVELENIHSLDLTNVGGQEREISVLCADVRDFTPFSERLEPEVLMQVINEYLSRASDAIELFEGVVDKYLGDAVTGLFNTQLNPQEDHAVRAVRAAMSMAYDVAELHAHLPEEQRLFYGIGIHTGMAVLGSVGTPERREFSAIGDAIDFGKLLQENAARGEVMLSEATYERVKDYFEVEPVTPRKTKGREDFTVMYKVLGIKRRAGNTQVLKPS